MSTRTQQQDITAQRPGTGSGAGPLRGDVLLLGAGAHLTAPRVTTEMTHRWAKT